MRSIINAIRTTVHEGKVETDLALFNGQEVIVLPYEDWLHIAGSDSTRYQLQQAQAEIDRLKALISAGEVTE